MAQPHQTIIYLTFYGFAHIINWIGIYPILPNSSVDVYNYHTDTVSNKLNCSSYSNVILLDDYNLLSIH